MKHIFVSAAFFALASFPASASSFEVIDEIVTGAKGSKSIITLGEPVPCAETACVDATGGNPTLKTAATDTGQLKKINFEFARKFADPANPVPTTVSDPSAEAPSETPKIPKAPADTGEIAAQPPVAPPMTPAAMGAPTQAQVDATRGTLPHQRFVLSVLKAAKANKPHT
jgi:hypothetical protein